MPFFQNPFSSPDFLGIWVLGDRQHSLDFKCPRNAGRGDEYVVNYVQAPYNLTGNDPDGTSKLLLTISFALNDSKNWADLIVTISGLNSAIITAQEVVTSLSANSTFNDFFTARLDQNGMVTIRQKQGITRFKFFIKNTGAEYVLKFNKLAGVCELPTFFNKHTIDNRFNYPDSQNVLIQLDPTLNVDAAVINNAVNEKGVSKGFSSGTVTPDYAFLSGRSGIFNFQKLTVDGSDRITQIIEYSAGATAGAFARKISYSYTGSNTKPDQITEIPYTLTNADIVTP